MEFQDRVRYFFWMEPLNYSLWVNSDPYIKKNQIISYPSLLGVQVQCGTMVRAVPAALVQNFADAFAEQQRLKEVSGLR